MQRAALTSAAFSAMKQSLVTTPVKPQPPPRARRSRRKARQHSSEESWVAFEQGRKAHHLRPADLFPAERTLCGKPALDADLHPLPVFNSFPADYRLCRMCCLLLPSPSLHPL